MRILNRVLETINSLDLRKFSEIAGQSLKSLTFQPSCGQNRVRWNKCPPIVYNKEKTFTLATQNIV